MKFDSSYQPWQCCSTDETRPILQHCLVKDDLIVACDGFILSVVPCELEDGDVPGLVLGEQLKKAAHAMPKRWSEVCLQLTDTQIEIHGGVLMPRFPSGDMPSCPDYTQVIQGAIRTRMDVPSNDFAVSPWLLKKVYEALGATKKSPCLRITRTGSTSVDQYGQTKFAPGPLIIEKSDSPNGTILPPYGIVMCRNLSKSRFFETERSAWTGNDYY